jgi:hypothetical protein
MSEQVQEQQPAQQNGASGPESRENLLEAWQRAQKTADASGSEPDPWDAPTERPEADGSAASDAEQSEADKPKPEPKKKAEAKPEPKAEDAEDKNEGKVSVAERAKWREKKRAEKAALETERSKLSQMQAAAEQYYQPLEKARQLVESGDYDAALRAMGLDGGLSEANKKHLQKQKGEDPRVERLQREQEELRRQLREREEREEHARLSRAQAQHRQQWLADQSAALEDHAEFGAVAKNEWYLEGIYAVQDQHWDGEETVSASVAAEEYRESLRSDPRAQQVYEALSWAFGDRGTENPEDRKSAVRSSIKTSARPGGKAPPRIVSQRSAAEASAPDRIKPDDPQFDIKLRNKFAALLEQASD